MKKNNLLSKFYLLFLFFTSLDYSYAQVRSLEDSNDIPELVNIQDWSNIEIINYLFGMDLTGKISNVTVWRKNPINTDKGGIFGFNDLDKVGRKSGLSPFSDFSTGIMFSTGSTFSFNNTTTSYTSFGTFDYTSNVNITSAFDRAGFSFTYNSTAAGIFKGRYIFGSEEYPDYNSTYRDRAVINVNGVNYARVNGAILNTASVSSTVNREFYKDNSQGSGNYDIEADGFTTVLTFEAPIKVGANTIQIYIEDYGADSLFDSWFFFTPYFTLPNVCPPSEALNITNQTLYIDDSHTFANLYDSGIETSEYTLKWYTTSDHTDGTEVNNPYMVSEGTYYLFTYNPDNFCYNNPAIVNVVRRSVSEICYNEPEQKVGGLSTNVGITTLNRPKIENSINWPYNIKGAWLSLESKSKGFVLSRLNNPEQSIINPVIGMIVYDTDDFCLKIYTSNGIWKCFNQQTCQ